MRVLPCLSPQPISIGNMPTLAVFKDRKKLLAKRGVASASFPCRDHSSLPSKDDLALCDMSLRLRESHLYKIAVHTAKPTTGHPGGATRPPGSFGGQAAGSYRRRDLEVISRHARIVLVLFSPPRRATVAHAPRRRHHPDRPPSAVPAPGLRAVRPPWTLRVARLIAERGDAKLTDLLSALANCSKGTNSAGIYDRCKARFEATIPRYRPVQPGEG